MNKGLRIWSFLVCSLIAVTVIAGIFATKGNDVIDQESTPVLRPNDLALVLRGEGVYAQNCASCHGADLKGEPEWRSTNPDGTLPAPPHDETGHTWHHADELLFRITKYGTAKAVGLDDYKSNMPAFEDSLTDEDMIAALSWIKAQWPEAVRERHDMMNERMRNSNQ